MEVRFTSQAGGVEQGVQPGGGGARRVQLGLAEGNPVFPGQIGAVHEGIGNVHIGPAVGLDAQAAAVL